MSRFDAEHEAEYKAQQARDAAAFTVGATVYRALRDRIETGTLRRVSRARVTPRTEEDEKHGTYPYYVAQFGGNSPFNGDWLGQTYSWEFFASEEEARAELIEQIENRIESKQREFLREVGDLHALRARVRAGVSVTSPEAPA